MRKRREEDRLGDWKRMVRKNRRGRGEERIGKRMRRGGKEEKSIV